MREREAMNLRRARRRNYVDPWTRHPGFPPGVAAGVLHVWAERSMCRDGSPRSPVEPAAAGRNGDLAAESFAAD